MQGRLHDFHLAVERDRQPARSGIDRRLRQLEGVEVALSIDTPEAEPTNHPEELKRRAGLDHVEPQLAGIEPVTPSEGEEIHAVFVVADEQARCAIRPGEILGRDPEAAPREGGTYG